MSCTRASHDLLRASPVAFRASVRMAFRFWSVDDAGRDEECHAGHCKRCGSTIAIPVRTLVPGNAHELAARSRKVGLILALVPVGVTRAEIDAIADVLVRFDQEQRDRFAAAAGAATPSPATWAEVVAGALGRRTAIEIFERALGPVEAVR